MAKIESEAKRIALQQELREEDEIFYRIRRQQVDEENESVKVRLLCILFLNTAALQSYSDFRIPITLIPSRADKSTLPKTEATKISLLEASLKDEETIYLNIQNEPLSNGKELALKAAGSSIVQTQAELGILKASVSGQQPGNQLASP